MLIALRVSTFSRATPSPPGGTLNPLQSDDGALTFHVYYNSDRCCLKTCHSGTNSLGSSPKFYALTQFDLIFELYCHQPRVYLRSFFGKRSGEGPNPYALPMLVTPVV